MGSKLPSEKNKNGMHPFVVKFFKRFFSYQNIILPGHSVCLNSSPLAPLTHSTNKTKCYLNAPSSCTQWAAVTSQFGLMMDAPQTCPLFLMWRLTCQGNSPSSAAWPPTIRDVLNMLLPQSAKQTQNHNLACCGIGVCFIAQCNTAMQPICGLREKLRICPTYHSWPHQIHPHSREFHHIQGSV